WGGWIGFSSDPFAVQVGGIWCGLSLVTRVWGLVFAFFVDVFWDILTLECQKRPRPFQVRPGFLIWLRG
ncbi:hypothetical protein KUV73_25155, partial [Mameliella alba]|nr:hypothetical protein [Mameliella alba]MBY6172689.1 hypothetical protein [Mameliella alba]MBY6177671.1 hypothetical protein [Mameliella alba]